MKKKYTAALLAAVMLTMTACGGQDTTNTTGTENAGEETTETDETAGDTAGEEETGETVDELLNYDPVLYEDLTSTLVSLGEYKGITAVRNVAEVMDADVQKEIRTVKASYGELVDVDREAELGDVVLIDFTGYVDGETSDNLQGTEYSLELGSGDFIPGFEDQLVGVKAGEDRELNLTFPEDYYEDMAGKDVTFDVHVHQVQAYEVEGWGDDFVKENLEYESVADMEAAIRQDLEAQAEEDADANVEYDLISSLLDSSEYEVQETDVEAYIDEMMSEYQSYASAMGTDLNTFLQSYLGVTEEQLREIFRETAVFRVKMTLTFHDIAELEGIEISDEEYQEQVNALAEQYGYEDTAAVEAVYSPEMIREQMIQEKVIDLIVDNAVIE